MYHIPYLSNNYSENLCKIPIENILYLNIDTENILNTTCLSCLYKVRSIFNKAMIEKEKELDILELSKYKVDSMIMQINLNKFNAVTEKHEE